MSFSTMMLNDRARKAAAKDALAPHAQPVQTQQELDDRMRLELKRRIAAGRLDPDGDVARGR